MENGTTGSEEILARADLLTGLAKLSALPPEVRSVTVAGDVTPFLGEGNEGKKAWRVHFPQVSLELPSASAGFRDRYRRSFAVTMDAAEGSLLHVISTYDGDPDPEMKPMPSCGKATAELSDEGEIYEGYPAEDPEIGLLDALDCILSGGVGSPFEAKEIHAVYVLHSRGGSDPKPVWAVTLRGIPPFRARGPEGDKVPIWQRNHMRNVVDAKTGQVLFATNSPQPS